MLGRRWTAAEDSLLRQHWRTDAPVAWATILPERNANAVWQRAWQLGLTGYPAGHVSLAQARQRTGYTSSKELAAICRAAGVEFQPYHAHTGYVRTQRQVVLAPWDDVLRAVMEHEQTETVCGAARRLGLWHSTLRVWLLEAGVVPPRSLENARKPVRIRSEVIDRVVAERRAARRAA